MDRSKSTTQAIKTPPNPIPTPIRVMACLGLNHCPKGRRIARTLPGQIASIVPRTTHQTAAAATTRLAMSRSKAVTVSIVVGAKPENAAADPVTGFVIVVR